MEMANGALAVAKASPAGTLRAFGGIPSDPIDLSAPLESLLIGGGDPRLNVDPARMLNRYGCRSWPNPEAFTFASSTASNISERGFAAAAAVHHQLLRAAGTTDLTTAACNRQAERLRAEIGTIWRLNRSGVEIVFSPSGTDSEVHALYVAEAVLGGPLVNVIVASDETGSGVPEAARGRHFSSSTAQSERVSKGERIRGFAADTANISIPVRARDGQPRSHESIDRAVADAVAESVRGGKHVVLHVMDTSKFGWRGPSSECVRHIRENWGHSVQVVVDACQMRLNRPRLASYLSQGFMVLITGSKFFAGPPFSGALLVPPSVSAVMERVDCIPDGLRLYANSSDWPVRWLGVRARLPSLPNVGQLLRWSAAVEEMRAYFDIPEPDRVLSLQLFASTVEESIAERPNLQLLPACECSGPNAGEEEEMGTRTIFPFFMRRQGKLLSVDECVRIYRALYCDMTHLLPCSAPSAQWQAAAVRCQIGQPVPARNGTEDPVGTLRISASARVAQENWSASGQVRLILDKIDLLVENLDVL